MTAGSGSGSKSAILRDPQTGPFVAVLSNWGDVPVLDLLRDLFLVSMELPSEPPTRAGLADVSDYAHALGTYEFDPGALSTALGIEDDSITLLAVDGRLYLTVQSSRSELLRATDSGGLALTYTDELIIEFERHPAGRVDGMVVKLNGRELRGARAGALPVR